MPPDYDPQVIYAIRNWSKGQMTEYQQKLLWDYVMYVTAAADEFQDLSYRPGADQIATAFAEGKRFVGMMIRKLLRPEFTPREETPTPDIAALTGARHGKGSRRASQRLPG